MICSFIKFDRQYSATCAARGDARRSDAVCELAYFNMFDCEIE